MLSLCIDTRMLHSGGIGTYIRNLLPYFSKEFRLILLGVDIPVHSKIYSVGEQLEIPLKIPPCDLAWFPHYNVPFLPVKAKRVVVTIHDTYHQTFAATFRWRERLYAKRVMKRAVSLAAKVITVSHFSAKEIQKHTAISPSRLKVIYSGIDHHLFYERSQETFFLEKRGIKKRFFLFVGNFKPNKNLKGILKAFQFFLEERDADLVLIGKRGGFIHGETIVPFGEEIKIFEDVTNEELPFFYSQAEALLFPSFYEGFGFPPLEAMACGCPVIASNIEALQETCKENAYFVDPSDPLDIKAKMVEIWMKKNSFSKEKGKQHAAAFSWERSAQEHMQLFKNLG